MLALLVESALRSLLLGAAVWLGLKLLRVKNPHAQMTAWTLVLVASLAMPALMRLVTVTIPAAPPAPLAQIVWPAPVVAPPVFERAPQPAQPIASAPRPGADEVALLPRDAPEVPLRQGIDWRPAATAAYALVAGMLLVRLIAGVLLTWRLARAARPVRAFWAAGLDVRVSDVVGVPVTFGSTILLPSEYVAWSTAKRRAVLIHERAHVAHADFYVLLFAALNRAVFWFNPFAWWQFVRLAELAEIISDDAALEALADRPRYAGILLDVAGRRQRALAALAMARPSTVRRRVERILAAREAPARADWRQRLLVAGALLPLVAASAVTLAYGTPPVPPVVATDTHEQSGASLGRYAGFYQAGPRAVLTIAEDGGRLSARITGQPRLELARESDTNYVSASPPARVSFVFDGEEPASALIVHQNNHEWRANRIDAAKASAIEARFAARIAAAPERFRNQAPVPGSRAAALQLIEQVQQSAPDDHPISMQLGDPARLRLPQLRLMLSALGPLQSLFFRGVGPGGYDIYGAQFANGSADFRLGFAADGTIEDILFRPNGDGRPGEMIACAQEQSLAPAPPTVPIQVVLFNGSGADIHLFDLNEGGQRKKRATIGDNRTAGVLTYVGQPLVVADAAGRCLGIVSPGVFARVFTVRSVHDGEPLVMARPARVMPRSGSEEALRRYIEAVGRGTPHYEEMTEEAAAEARARLLLEQAILARLGPLRVMTFRVVSPFDNDVYMGQFANGAAEWRIRLLDDGRIAGIALGPQY